MSRKRAHKPVPAAPEPAGAPTPERLKRGDVEQPSERRSAYTARTPIGRLYVAGKITYGQDDAARQWRGDYEVGVLRVRDGASATQLGIRGPTNVSGINDFQADALGRWRSAMQAVGMIASQVLTLVVLQDHSPRFAATRTGRHHKTLDRILFAGLRDLESFYANTGSRRKAAI